MFLPMPLAMPAQSLLKRVFLLLALTTGFTAGARPWPDRVFAPYMYLGSGDAFKITQCHQLTGQAYYTLAFIIADPQNHPAWDGRFDMEKDVYASEIQGIRRQGGDVIVSFGGADGREIARVETNAAALQSAYQTVINRYHLTWLDFDIEGKALKESGINELRNTVLARLQIKNPGLRISYTLPVDPHGIPKSGLNLLADAQAKGVKVYSANVMTMDYDPGYLRGKTMANVSIASALKAREQCQAIDPAIRIGLTPMIGQNDEKSEIFTQQNARELLAWAQTQPWVASLSFWSSNRDAGKSVGPPTGNTSSGITQKPWEFTLILKPFTTGRPRTVPTAPTGGDRPGLGHSHSPACASSSPPPPCSAAETTPYPPRTYPPPPVHIRPPCHS